MKVLILAAGYGTRLYPRTQRCPKPLLKIGSRPIINYLIDKLEELRNISRIIVVTNDRFYKQFRSWKEDLDVRYPICLLNDLSKSPHDRLGAIGDIDFALSKEGLASDFLILGGDNFFKDRLVEFMSFAKKKHPAVTVGLFDIEDKYDARHYGVVRLDKKNRIVEFCEKPSRPVSSLVAMCLYYFSRQKLRFIKEYLSSPSHSRDTVGTYINWLISKDEVYGFIFKGFWLDIGSVSAYKTVEKTSKDIL